MKMMEYEGIAVYTHPEVCGPSEDTFLLAKNLDISRKDEVLEIGTGTGLIAVYTAQRTKNVVATDINEHAIKCALKNTIFNKTYNIELRQGNLFEPVEGEKFDLILFNSSYLPLSEDEKIVKELNTNLDNNLDIRDTIDKFISNVKNYLKEGGRLQLVQSSISDHTQTLAKLEELGFDAEITAIKKCPSEEIVVINGKLK
jgi:release factor glutamine methyltransferase